MELLNPGEYGVDLEGKAPSLGLLVVFLKHVDVLAAQVLPVGHRLFDPFGLRHFLSEDLQEGGLATADVSFNGKAVIPGLELGVEFKVLEILIQTSR